MSTAGPTPAWSRVMGRSRPSAPASEVSRRRLLAGAVALAGLAPFPRGAGAAAPAEAGPGAEELPDARELVAAALDQVRGETSYAEIELAIVRPDWRRDARLVAWTRGRDDALIRFTAPPRDAGTATLKVGDDLWTWNPRLRRVIRLPESLLGQSWAGTDFSYGDLARSDDLLRHYALRLASVDALGDGLEAHSIVAVPRPAAPVVWGRENLVLRSDHVLLEHVFYDQDGFALKRLETLEIRTMDGRPVPARLRMSRLDEPGHYTELAYRALDFGVPLDDDTFTQFRLREGS